MAIKASEQITLTDITDAYSVILTSETYTFVGNTSGAPSGLSCTTSVVAYCGSTICPKVTISTVQCPTGISAAVSNNGSSSPTITFTTKSTITNACEATIPVSVDGVTINKKFSFAVAKQGADGVTDDIKDDISNAAKVATNYLGYDSTNGLQIGNKSSGSWSGFRTQITSSAFNILNAAGAVLASYGASIIELGKSSVNSIIKLCGGKGQLQYNGDEKYIELYSADNVRIRSSGKMASLYSHWYDGENNAKKAVVNVSQNGIEIAAQTSSNINPDTQLGSFDTTSVNVQPLSIDTYTNGETYIYAKNGVTIDSGLSYINLNGSGVRVTSGDLQVTNGYFITQNNKGLKVLDTSGNAREIIVMNADNQTVLRNNLVVVSKGLYVNENVTVIGNLYGHSDCWLGSQLSTGIGWIGFYNAYGSSTRKAYIGYSTKDAKDFYIVNETGGVVKSTTNIWAPGFRISGSGISRSIACTWNDNATHDILNIAANDSSGYCGPASTVPNTTMYLRGKTIRLTNHGGGTYLGASGSTAITSDRNLKKDIFNISDKYEKFFKKLRPVSYKYDSEENKGHRDHLGYIAQEVEEALFQSDLTTEEFAGIMIERDVTINTNYDSNLSEQENKANEIHYDKLYSLRYEEFIALNTHMIQKLQNIADDQKNVIDNLKDEVSNLKKELSSLKDLVSGLLKSA